jgi:hypothetical protein
MALFRRGLPKRAVVAAFLGFVYGALLMPIGGTLQSFLMGAGWVLLSVSLLFGRTLSYYSYVIWALLWMAWRGVLVFQGKAGNVLGAVFDVLVPLVSVALLSSSGYVEAVRGEEPRGA